MEVALELKGMCKDFGSVHAVKDMDVRFMQGEIHCIVGENGSGKSTLASMISGSLKPTAGVMIKDGKPHAPGSMLDARKNGISILVQEQGTINGLSVCDNIFLGRESSFSKSGKMVDHKRMQTEARRVLDGIQLSDVQPDDNINSVSFEDRKLIEVAIALSDDPDILILDETTTALSHKGRDIVYRIIQQMRQKGKTIVFISHDLKEVQQFADTVTVMRDGEYVTTMTKAAGDISVDSIRLNMIGRDLSGHYYRADTEESCEDETILTANNVYFGKLIKGASLELKKGEILGIGGLTDSGMHELGKAMFGAVKIDDGQVISHPSGKQILRTSDATACKIAYLSKNRDSESMMMGATIKQNIVLSAFDKLKTWFYISDKSEKDLATEYAQKLDIRMSSINQMVGELSGGNKQKVVVAKWLANDSKVLIMDCPTRGIDVGVKATIYRIMEDLKAQGISIVMISEEMPELIGMSDRIIIMKNGEITGTFLRSQRPTEQDIIQCMI